MTCAASPDSHDQKRQVIRYGEALASDVFAFQRLAYPDRRADWIEPRWRWMFLDSAARVGVEPLVWLCRADAAVIGQRAAIAVMLHTRAGQFVTGWMVDTTVLGQFRGQSLGGALVARATADLPLSLSLGQTEQIRRLQSRCGWRDVATMDSWLLVLNARRAFRGRLRNALARFVVAGAGWAWQRARGRLRTARTRRLSSRPIETFDVSHDQLWDRVCSQYGCAVVRDASYLNWKYVAQPGQSFKRLEVRDGGVVRGLCVWNIHEPDTGRAYRRGWILDLVVDHSDDEAVAALLDAVTHAAVEAEVDVLEFDLLGRGLRPHLRRYGFVRTSRTRHLRVSTGPAHEQVAAVIRSADEWYATRGDSDGDHPWRTSTGRVPSDTITP